MINYHCKIQDLNYLHLIDIDSFRFRVVYSAYTTAQKAMEWSQDKFSNAIYPIFKMALARLEHFVNCLVRVQQVEGFVVLYSLKMVKP